MCSFPLMQSPLKLTRRLGGGTYGDVYEAVADTDGEEQEKGKGRIDELNKRYAVKYYRDETRTIMQEGISCTTLRELSTVQRLKHPNLVRVEDVFIDVCDELQGALNKMPEMSYSPEQIFVCAAYEFCAGGDMEEIIRKSRHQSLRLSGLSVEDTKHYAFQLLNGLSYLHSSRISHRDLKPANIMLDHSGLLKIGDMGLCREIKTHSGSVSPTVCTIFYRPVEVILGRVKLNGEPTNTEKNTKFDPARIFCASDNEKSFGPHYGLGIDIWGAACIICEMVTGYPIFRGTTEYEIFARITHTLGSLTETDWMNCSNLEYWPCTSKVNEGRKNKMQHHNFDPTLKIGKLSARLFNKVDSCGIDLLLRMFNYNPHFRISAAEALSHPWFSDVSYKRLDGIGVKNWFMDILKFRMGQKTYGLLKDRYGDCLESSELGHVICRVNYRGNLYDIVDTAFKNLIEQGYHFNCINSVSKHTQGNRNNNSNNEDKNNHESDVDNTKQLNILTAENGGNVGNNNVCSLTEVDAHCESNKFGNCTDMEIMSYRGSDDKNIDGNICKTHPRNIQKTSRRNVDSIIGKNNNINYRCTNDKCIRANIQNLNNIKNNLSCLINKKIPICSNSGIVSGSIVKKVLRNYTDNYKRGNNSAYNFQNYKNTNDNIEHRQPVYTKDLTSLISVKSNGSKHVNKHLINIMKTNGSTCTQDACELKENLGNGANTINQTNENTSKGVANNEINISHLFNCNAKDYIINRKLLKERINQHNIEQKMNKGDDVSISKKCKTISHTAA